MNSQSAAPAKEELCASLLPTALINATLIKSVPLSASAHHLTFQVESEELLEFLPGQSISIEVPIHGKSTPTPYSIASAPRSDNCFELCLRRGTQGSPAARLCELEEGMQVRSTRPKGVFVLQQPAGDTVFLAAGTGIAPIRSMLHWLLKKEDRHSDSRRLDSRRPESKTCLIFGARESESLFFHHEFLQLAQQHSNFHYLPTLSRPEPHWRGANGYVQDHLHRLPARPESAHAYLCGPAAMISNVREVLEQHGWPDKQVHYERHES
jgi:CDP-4-dehydro-6-deoxyglucose reductase